MTPEFAVLMARYNAWMNQRLFAAAATLPQWELHRDAGAFFGSLFDTLNHIAVGDTIWLHRFALSDPDDELAGALSRYPKPISLRQALGHTLRELQAYRLGLDEVIVAWASRLTTSRLQQTLTYVNMAGEPQAKNLGALVLHFFNHQTHHRGQATTLLHQAGVDVGVTDLLAVIPTAV